MNLLSLFRQISAGYLGLFGEWIGGGSGPRTVLTARDWRAAGRATGGAGSAGVPRKGVDRQWDEDEALALTLPTAAAHPPLTHILILIVTSHQPPPSKSKVKLCTTILLSPRHCLPSAQYSCWPQLRHDFHGCHGCWYCAVQYCWQILAYCRNGMFISKIIVLILIG